MSTVVSNVIYAWVLLLLLLYCFSATVSAEVPNFLQLVNIDLPSRIGPKIKVFGTFILQDDHGNKMVNIRKSFREDPEEMAMEVLREWLAGKGVEVTWESLMATSKLHLMADQIQMALDQLQS